MHISENSLWQTQIAGHAQCSFRCIYLAAPGITASWQVFLFVNAKVSTVLRGHCFNAATKLSGDEARVFVAGQTLRHCCMILVGRLPAPLAPAPISSPLRSLLIHTGTRAAASRSSQAWLHVRQSSKSALILKEPASLLPPLMRCWKSPLLHRLRQEWNKPIDALDFFSRFWTPH